MGQTREEAGRARSRSSVGETLVNIISPPQRLLSGSKRLFCFLIQAVLVSLSR